MTHDVVEEDFKVDAAGTPTGGRSKALGIDVAWQDGPIVADGVTSKPNGARVEAVITVALNRLRFYQTTKFACHDNEQAILELEKALAWLHQRSAARQARGVKGSHQV